MTDPAGEIRHLLGRYEEAMSAGDLATLSELHWQDDRYVHLGPEGIDAGWAAREKRLQRVTAGRKDSGVFRLSDIRVEVFHGKFASACGRWEGSPEAGAGVRAGLALFVLSRMGSSWKIVADHQR